MRSKTLVRGVTTLQLFGLLLALSAPAMAEDDISGMDKLRDDIADATPLQLENKKDVAKPSVSEVKKIKKQIKAMENALIAAESDLYRAQENHNGRTAVKVRDAAFYASIAGTIFSLYALMDGRMWSYSVDDSFPTAAFFGGLGTVGAAATSAGSAVYVKLTSSELNEAKKRNKDLKDKLVALKSKLASKVSEELLKEADEE